MKRRLLAFLFLLLSAGVVSAQVTGLLENFNDNSLTGWAIPGDQTAGTFALTESDSMLRIDYNRNTQSWEWDTFYFTPSMIIDATQNPYITVRAKSSVGTVLTFKPNYENGQSDWLQVKLSSDNIWYTYKFEMVATQPYEINSIFMYLNGGSTQSQSGTVYFDDLRIGDSVRTVDVLDVTELERLIGDANALYNNSVEGVEEGQFESGSKAVLSEAISSARNILARTDLTNSIVDSTVWALADACVNFEIGVQATDMGLIDPLATKQTKYLYINLNELAGSFLLFGMHDATGYGVGWVGDDDRSDVKDVCGSYPAVYSEDMNQVDRDHEVERMRYRLTSAYNRGGVITICWHQYDPEGRGFYSNETGTNGENIVATLLPGGEYHQFYKDRLTKISHFLKTLRGLNGESIPVIFRPYHEHTGGWFWWGIGQCSTEEYNQIWRFTVVYLRDSLNVHNLIYVLSPSAQHLDSKDDYYDVYPGEAYIDIFGFDHYFNSSISVAETEEFRNDMRRVAQAAKEQDKLAAITEVGQVNITTTDLYTQYILNPVKTDSLTKRMAYAATWRNQDTNHFHAPYPGHPSVPDFIDFYNDSYTIFEDNLPDMYQLSYLDEIPPQVIDYPEEEFTAYETDVPLQIKTNERAFMRYSFTDQSYTDMPFEFQKGQGSFDHSTVIDGMQGESYHLFIRGADYNGNMMDASVEVMFTIDTLQRPVKWNEINYNVSDWTYGTAPFHFNDGTTQGTTVPYSRTVYTRKVIEVNNLDSLFQMVAFVKYDNGFVLYVNGHEVRRVNMADGEVNYHTWAGTSTQSSTTVTLNAAVLALMHHGQNVIAAEIHQSSTDTSDFKFDLQLIDPDVVIAYGSDWYAYAAGKEPEIKTIGANVIAEQNVMIPQQVYLAQNYPNPFNPSTTIRFAISETGPVRLTVYDLSGRRVVEVVNQRMTTGWYQVTLNGAGLASGIYYYQLVTSQDSLVRKMILIK